MERVVQSAHVGADSEGIGVGDPRLDHVNLTIKHKPLFRLYCAEAYQYAHRGSVYPYLVEVERMDGFDGEIVLERGDRQNRDMDGIEIWKTVVPMPDTQAYLPIYLPESMHINVQSQSQLYTQAYAIFEDDHGQTQSVLVLSEKRNMLRTLPPVVKLHAPDEPLQLAVGEVGSCSLRLERTTNFGGPMQVELINAPPGIESAAVTIPEGSSEAMVEVRITTDFRAVDAEPAWLTWRAIGQLNPQTKVITEAKVQLLASPKIAP